MLNKKALESAETAYYRKRDGGLTYAQDRATMLEVLEAAIEAYLAALPDEGLVMKLRALARGKRLSGTLVDEQVADLFEEAADALEAARAAAPEVSDENSRRS